MAEKHVSQDQALRHQQADAFLRAIHAPQEEKARILQQYPELTGVVDHFESSVRTHLAQPPAFDEEVNSGRFEQRLADDIRHGDLQQFDRLPESNVRPANKQYDTKTGLLIGFDLAFGPDGESLAVDVSDYLPPGKSLEATRQLREDLFSMYQFSIKRNPETADERLRSIAEQFPHGIVWQEPEHGSGALDQSGQLIMQGVPNLQVMISQSMGEGFLRLHDQVSAYAFRLGDYAWKEKYMPGAAAELAASLMTHDPQAAINETGLPGQLLRNHYPWPGWDRTLGEPPIISFDVAPDQAYLSCLNEVLSRVAALARNESAASLRAQLAELGGMPINMTPGIGLPRTDANVMQHAPVLQFDPAAWGRYPIEGARILPRSGAEESDAPHRYGETTYGIAAPEQLLLGELGRYVLHHKAHQASLQFESTGDANFIAQAGKFSALAQLGRYAIDHYENPAMQSVFPEFKLRDAGRAGEMGLLYGGEHGLPKVQAAEQAALDFALRVHQGASRLHHAPIEPGALRRPSPHSSGRSDHEDSDLINQQKAEAFRLGRPCDVIRAYPDLADTYGVLATLGHSVGESGLTAHDRTLALQQIKENLASSIAAGRIPEILAAADVEARPEMA